MLYWLYSYCIKTIIIIAYKMVVLFMACCTCTVLFFCLYFVYCMIVLFVDNLFFTWAASQWAVRLLWQPSDCMAIFVILCHVIIGEYIWWWWLLS